jgi:peroxiredoxin
MRSILSYTGRKDVLIKRHLFFQVFVSVIILCVFFLSSCSGNHTDSAQPGSPGHDKAHAFTLNDLSGESFSLSDLSGQKSALLIFTTTWCPQCVTAIPDLKRMHGNYQGKNLELLAIYIRESNSKVSEFKARYSLPYRALLDSDASVASLYNVRGVPTFVLMDKNGDIKYKGHNIPENIIEQVTGD